MRARNIAFGLFLFALGWACALFCDWSYQVDYHTTDQTNEVFPTPEGAVIAPKRVVETHFSWQSYRERSGDLFGGENK